MGLKLPELLLIFFAVMLLFGATRLPQLGSSLGAAIRNFKRGFSGEDEKDPAKKLAEGDPSGPLTTHDKASSKQG